MNTPRHRFLYDMLKKHISEGIYSEGDLLPSENELCRIYGMTRPTVRQALGRLENEGLINKHQGKGSIVRNPRKDIGILSVSGTTSAVGDLNLRTKIIVKPVIIPWPENFMFPLSDMEKESGCIYMERLRFLENEPVFYDITYIANINLSRITSRQFEDSSLFGILRDKYNIEIRGGEQRIRAMPVTSRIGGLLKMKKDQPILHLERRIETSHTGLYLYSSIYCNTVRYAIFGRF